MAYTYSGNPNASLIDATHFYLGDTNPADVISTDEECAFALAANHNHPMLAAASLAETKAAQLVMRPTSVRRGDRMTSWSPLAAQGFLTLARQLRQNASIATATVYAGGIDVGEKQAARADRSTVQPYARVDLHMAPRPLSIVDEEREA